MWNNKQEDTLKRGESEIAVNPNGTGPFKLTYWNSGDVLRFEPFEESFMGKPEIDELVLKQYQKETTDL